jgi:hypothetical protein
LNIVEMIFWIWGNQLSKDGKSSVIQVFQVFLFQIQNIDMVGIA